MALSAPTDLVPCRPTSPPPGLGPETSRLRCGRFCGQRPKAAFKEWYILKGARPSTPIASQHTLSTPRRTQLEPQRMVALALVLVALVSPGRALVPPNRPVPLLPRSQVPFAGSLLSSSGGSDILFGHPGIASELTRIAFSGAESVNSTDHRRRQSCPSGYGECPRYPGKCGPIGGQCCSGEHWVPPWPVHGIRTMASAEKQHPGLVQQGEPGASWDRTVPAVGMSARPNSAESTSSYCKDSGGCCRDGYEYCRIDGTCVPPGANCCGGECRLVSFLTQFRDQVSGRAELLTSRRHILRSWVREERPKLRWAWCCHCGDGHVPGRSIHSATM